MVRCHGEQDEKLLIKCPLMSVLEHLDMLQSYHGKLLRVLERQASGLFSCKGMSMPTKPKKPCQHPGCPRLTNDRYCELHAKLHVSDRAGSADRGYTSRWQTARKRFLTKHPLCIECEEEGKLTPASVVDHIIAHRGDKALFWDEDNWQPLCKKCHDRKTRTMDQHQEYTY